MKERPEIPEEKFIEVKNNTKKIDFTKRYKFLYFEWWFYLLTLPIFMIAYVLVAFSAVFFGLRVKGRKHFRSMRGKGFITVSNHCHFFDTVLANFVYFPRRIYISVVQRNFEVPFVRWVLRVLKAFPIPASPVGFKMITEPVGEAIRRGHAVLFLPEGELVHLSQTIHRFRPGAFYQSYIHQTPILPMVYTMRRRKFFGKEMGPNWVRMTLNFGAPVAPPPKQEGVLFPKEALDEMAEEIASWMEKVIAEYHGTGEQKG
jgi:1-acyl-sn-glycerol-3-phosphate acyltransferase